MSSLESTTMPYERHAALGVSDWYLGHLFTWLATSKDTGGRLWLAEIVARQGQEPPIHVHQGADELFYVIEGEGTWFCGGREFEAGPGSLVWLPRTLPHGFELHTPAVKMLALCVPGIGEEVFQAFSERADALTLGPVPELPEDAYARMAELMSQAGEEIVGPPFRRGMTL